MAPVLKCAASLGDGVPELVSRLDDHFAWLDDSGRLADRRRNAALEHAHRVLERSVRRDAAEVWADWLESTGADAAADLESPYAIARSLAARIRSNGTRSRD